MPWLSRSSVPVDLVTPAAFAQYGRVQLLGPELSGVRDADAALAALAPLRERLYRDARSDAQVADEIRRHMRQGEWEAVGAWRFVDDFVADAALAAEADDAALLALARMRITNLAVHLPLRLLGRFRELTSQDPPNDGFFGPPVFDSAFGPSRRYYFDSAVAAAAARSPTRVPSRPGVPPGPLDDALGSLWDFGMLVLRGPLLVGQDARFEPSTVRAAVAAATDVDHELLADALRVALGEQRTDFNGWAWLGAARFVEDYLDPRLTASPAHAALADEGLRQLTERGLLGLAMPLETLSEFECSRL